LRFDDISDSHAVCTGASGAYAVARAPDAMEAAADAAIPSDVVTKVVNTAHVVSGARGVAAFTGVRVPEPLCCPPLDSRCQQRGIH